MSSGNARRRIKKRKRARAKHWDLLATKTLLLPGNPDVETRLKAINTVNNRGTRKKLVDALRRAGIVLSRHDWEHYQKGPTTWNATPTTEATNAEDRS